MVAPPVQAAIATEVALGKPRKQCQVKEFIKMTKELLKSYSPEN